MNKIYIGTSVLMTTLLSACSTPEVNTQNAKPLGMANPASVYCQKMGGESQIKKDALGNEAGYCKLPNGTVVDEWKLFRSAQGDEQATTK